jgi:hypothetical protein
MPPIYPILIFLLSPTFYFWHIWYTHTLANNNNKKAYCYYTSLAVFRDISSRIPLTGSKTINIQFREGKNFQASSLFSIILWAFSIITRKNIFNV